MEKADICKLTCYAWDTLAILNHSLSGKMVLRNFVHKHVESTSFKKHFIPELEGPLSLKYKISHLWKMQTIPLHYCFMVYWILCQAHFKEVGLKQNQRP